VSSIEDAIRSCADSLRAAEIESYSLDARVLAAHACSFAPENFTSLLGAEISLEQLNNLRTLTARRSCGEPIAYLTGAKEFWSLEFKVTPDTLIPRPDSETIVAALLGRIPQMNAPLRILDLGTGTGCLLLSLLSELPNATGVGVDRSGAATVIAETNAQLLGLRGRTVVYESDWLENVNGLFDIIVANPPYITDDAMKMLPRSVEEFEPRLALSGGPDGLVAYREIANGLSRVMAPNAFCAFEIGEGQADDVCVILSACGFFVSDVEKDLAGRPRCVLASYSGKRNFDGSKKALGMRAMKR
jgi:release factor glutamine methyltransferase